MAQTETPYSLTPQNHLDDFNFALYELETSYAGFETCVTDANRQQYDSIVSSLRVHIETQNRPGYDAAIYLYSWFDDGHLGIDMGSYRETGKYMSDRQKFHPYEMIKPYSPEPTANQVTSRTFLIRLPDFDEETVSVEWIGNAIRNFNTSTCENLIIDVRYNGSATEELLIQAKAISDKTSIYGKENTSGCLDYSSVRETTALPHSKYPIFIPTARSCRLPDNGIDKTGIAPDFIIPIDYPQSLTDNLDEWTVWVAGDLEN